MHKLSNLGAASFRVDHPLLFDQLEPVLWQQFVVDIGATRSLISHCDERCWALYHLGSYDFAVGLFALLAENKTVYLPGENHPGITADLRRQEINLLGQFPATACTEIAIAADVDPTRDFSLGGNIVVYTSGSTGAAKPITKTLAQVDLELHTLEANWGSQWGDPVIASTVSHQHFYGLLFSLLWPLCCGRRFCRKPFIDPAIMASTTADLAQVIWVMSPAHLHRMPDNMPWEKLRRQVPTVFSSGGPLEQWAAQDLYHKIGHYPIEVLGSSETGGIASRQQQQVTTPWQSLPGVEIRIDEGGLLAVRSPWLDSDDWYPTADLANAGVDGSFVLGMRADRIVKLEGKRVALPEVEAALVRHSWIAEAAVVPVSRKRQSLGAVLVLTALGRDAYATKSRHLFNRELREYLRARLSAAALPRLWRIRSSLPRNTQGKIITRELLALFEQTPLPTVTRRHANTNECTLELYVEADNPYFEGHFSDNPVLAGVVQLLWAQQFGRIYLPIRGAFSGMKAIKFRELVFPGRSLQLSLAYQPEAGRLNFHFDSGEGRHSQGALLFEEHG